MLVVITDLVKRNTDDVKKDEIINITFESYDYKMNEEDQNTLIDIFEDNYNKAKHIMIEDGYTGDYFIRILMCDGKNLRIFNNENDESILKMYVNGKHNYFMHSSYCGSIIFAIKDGNEIHRIYATKVTSRDKDFTISALEDSLDIINSYGCDISITDNGIAIGKENCQFTIDVRYFDGESSILRELEHFS